MPTRGKISAEYSLYVRDSDRNLVGQVDSYTRFLGVTRHNLLGSWALELDLKHPMAPYLVTRGYGLMVQRRVYDPSGKLILSHVPISGPVLSMGLGLAGRSLVVGGDDDLHALAARDAWPVVAYPYAAAILADSPAIWLKLNEPSGTAAADSSGNSRNATYFGSPTLGVTPGLVDDGTKAAALNGTTQYVATNASTGVPSGNAVWTQEIWFRVASAPASSVALASLGTQTNNNLCALLLQANLAPRLDLFGISSATGPTAVALNVAHHLAGVYTGSALILYLDGAQVATVAASSLALTSAKWFLGARNTGGDVAGSLFPGTIHSAALYPTALSAARIAAHYALGASRFAASAYDSRSGAAETVIRGYIDANCISPIADQLALSRVVPGLAFAAADTGQGSHVNEDARFWKLATSEGDGLVQSLAQRGGIGVRVRQDGTTLGVEFYTPQDRTATVKFGADLGTLSDYQVQIDAPDASQHGNVVVVAGQGDGVDREILLRADSTSLANWGRIEQFVDARDLDQGNVSALESRGDEQLAEGAEQQQLTLRLAAQKALVWGRDFDVGDRVSVAINGVVYQEVIREIELQLDSDGQETITPTVATPGAAVVRGIVAGLAQQAKRTTARVRRIERAQ